LASHTEGGTQAKVREYGAEEKDEVTVNWRIFRNETFMVCILDEILFEKINL